MTDSTDDQNPDAPTDEDLEAERAGQSTTAEAAMVAATDEEGFADESAYTPSTITDDSTDSPQDKEGTRP